MDSDSVPDAEVELSCVVMAIFGSEQKDGNNVRRDYWLGDSDVTRSASVFGING